jgi:uncharacterized Zn finger protein
MDYYWQPYVKGAKSRAKAERKINKLKKKGVKIDPIQIEGRRIATTFWGKAWCDHIESFSDYENRLPRGRTYVRNDLVCHLEINKGEIKAIVAGSELYNVNIIIESLAVKKWQVIKSICSGKIGSLLDLLSGKLSDGVMDVVCHRKKGLFPLSEEIEFSCDCPDWADMCKHIAAVLYGVGSRLDRDPAKLFLLRGVDHEELVDVSSAIIDATKGGEKKHLYIEDSEISDIFDIDMLNSKSGSNKKLKKAKEKKKSVDKSKKKRVQKDVKRKKFIKKIKKNTRKTSTFPKYLNGASIRKKRKMLGLTQANFANKVGVSASTVSKWERGKGRLILRADIVRVLKRIWK